MKRCAICGEPTPCGRLVQHVGAPGVQKTRPRAEHHGMHDPAHLDDMHA